MDYRLGDKAEFERFFGVYETFDLVPTLGVNPFDSKEWVETNQPRTLQLKRTSEEKGIPEPYFFPVIAVAESKIREKGNVKIVDIGGGYGENYLNIIRCLKTAGIEYHVIEQVKNCKAGRELSISGNILFHENVGGGQNCLNEECCKVLQGADICLIIGTLQYFPVYVDLLKEIAGKVEYVFVTRTIMSNYVNTFYTRQYIASDSGKYKDIVIGDLPVAVINHHELNQCMENLGYKSCLDLFHTDYSGQFRNFEKPYNKVEYRDILYGLNK